MDKTSLTYIILENDTDTISAAIAKGVAERDPKCVLTRVIANENGRLPAVPVSDTARRAAVNKVKEMALKGDGEACALLGFYYGPMTKYANDARSSNYLEDGVTFGNLLAKCRLADFLSCGFWCRYDLKRAIALYSECLEAGFSKIGFDLGLVRIMAQRTHTEQVRGFTEIKTAAEHPSKPPCASFVLGLLCERGIGTKRDPEAARFWIERATPLLEKAERTIYERIVKNLVPA